MPNATVRANARPMPKPKPGSAEAIRRKTEELESATALLKAGHAAVPDTAEGIIERDWRKAYFTIEDKLRDVCAWASAVRKLAESVQIPRGANAEGSLSVERLQRVIYQLDTAAAALTSAYDDGFVPENGAPPRDDQAEAVVALWNEIARTRPKGEVDAAMAALELLFPRRGDRRAA